jgi:CBS domain containing-hemolysin-like protein
MIWLLLIFCLLAASLLAGVESALLTVSRVRARHAASEGDKAAQRLTALLEHRNDLVQAAIAANHLLSLTAFVVLAVIMVVWLGTWGIVLAVVLALPIFLMALELVPKSLFRRYPFRLLKRSIPVLRLLHVIAMPWRLLRRFFKVADSPMDAAIVPAGAGLTALSESIGHLNLLPEAAASMMQRFAVFDGQTAASLMEPLKSVSALPAELPLATAAQLARETGSRHHAVMDAEGQFVGCLDAASIPATYGADKLVRQFAHPITRLRGKDTAIHCLQSMRKSGAIIALVKDEAGNSIGLLRIDRLLAWVTGK